MRIENGEVPQSVLRFESKTWSNQIMMPGVRCGKPSRGNEEGVPSRDEQSPELFETSLTDEKQQ